MIDVDAKLEANICPFCIIAFHGSFELLKHVFQFHKHPFLTKVSNVNVMLEANLPICPICITTMNDSLELLKHVFQKHVFKIPFLKCEETCQNVINTSSENNAVKIEVTENVKVEQGCEVDKTVNVDPCIKNEATDTFCIEDTDNNI